MRSWLCGLVAALACLGFGEPAAAQAPEVRPAADWIVPLSARDVGPAATGAGVEVVALDDQLRFGGEGTVEKYRLNRTRVTTEAGLAAVSTVSIEWDPSRETVAVHAIRILRGDRVIDVLADQSFEVLRREAGLEAALMTGWLTATLQPRDLRVGDVLETAYTIRGEGGALAPHREALVSANYDLPIGRYRLRATWPADRPVRIGALSPWETVQPRRVRDQWVYEVQADDLQPVFVPEDLPVRFSMIRAVQFTDHAGWGDIVGQMQPLYDRAAVLDPGSPLLAEIERIRGTHATDHDRASAVLRLVQDEVRYLALAMGEGGYVPASADEVWRSRYGDCKGKTVLLLALLRGLGIEADAALVSTGHGDGLDSRLPLVAWFDHVIVRVVIDGQVFWIDGASLGDRAIADVVPPPYAWALPIRPGVEALESIVQPEARVPALDQIFEVDNTGGLDAEAPFRLETRYAGPTALFMREAAGALSREQLLAQATAGRDPTRSVMRVTDIETRYDETTNVFSLIATGVTRTSWIRSSNGRVVGFAEATINYFVSPERNGVFASWADAPYRINHPMLRRMTLRLTLPDGGEGFSLEPNDRRIEVGGYRYDRRTTMTSGVVETVYSMASLGPEVSAEAMAEARRRRDRSDSLPPQVRAPLIYATTSAGSARPGDTAAAGTPLDQAQSLAFVGDFAAALAMLDDLIAREPENDEALRYRAAVRREAEDLAGSRADYESALALDPADVEALAGLGVTDLADDRPAEAIVSFSVALRLDPRNVTALTGRGAAYYRIGNWARSLDDYRAAKAGEGGGRTGLLGELRALIRLERYDEAREIARAALAENPIESVAIDALVRLEEAAGQPQAALPVLDAALAAVHDDPWFLVQRAAVRARSGDTQGAREDFSRVRTLADGAPPILNALCWRQAVSGFDLEQALADCDEAVASGRPNAQGSRAFVLLWLGRAEEARDLFQALSQDRAIRASSTFGLGLAKLSLGDASGAEDLSRARVMDIDVDEPFRVFLDRHPALAPSRP